MSHELGLRSRLDNVNAKSNEPTSFPSCASWLDYEHWPQTLFSMELPLRRADRARRWDPIAEEPPQVESQLKLHQRQPQYGRPVGSLHSSASLRNNFGPVYDAAFASVQTLVFQIEQTSATPIAEVIRQEMNDAQMTALLDGASEPVSPTGSKIKNKARLPNLGNPDRPFIIMSLKEVIAKARVRHAENLYWRGEWDVDIVYNRDRYCVEPLKTDRETIEAAGGRAYHMHPFKAPQGEMVLSAIVKAETLETLFTSERRAQDDIEIRVNTLPALPVAIVEYEPDAAGKGTIFPTWKPGPVGEPTEKAMARTMSRINRVRSDSLRHTMTVEKTRSWRPYASSDHLTRSGSPSKSGRLGSQEPDIPCR